MSRKTQNPKINKALTPALEPTQLHDIASAIAAGIEAPGAAKLDASAAKLTKSIRKQDGDPCKTAMDPDLDTDAPTL